MSRRQTLAVIVGFFAFLWGAGLTLYFGADMGAGRVATAKAPQRFTAREGTTREKALALVSSARDAGVDEFERLDREAARGTEDSPTALDARSISKPQSTFQRDMAQAILDRAAAEETPETRAEALENALGAPADASVEPVARAGQLAGQTLGAARRHEEDLALYRRALEGAGDAETKLDAAQRAAALARQLGRLDEARAVLSETLDETMLERRAAPPGERALGALILLGDIARESGEDALAERAYAEAVDTGLRQEWIEAGTGEAFRLAAMRLTRLLRELGRHEEATLIGRRVQGRLLGADARE